MRRKYELARKLRKTMTEPEKLLWYRIKERQEGGPIFRRQDAIGPYIADFYCVRAKLIVEVDGTFHYEDAHLARDTVRDKWLTDQGIMVYRLPAADVYADADGCADGVILLALSRLKNR